MSLSEAEQQTVKKHLMESESMVDSYAGADEAVVVTDVRLLRVADRDDTTSVDSTLLRGPHVVGSRIESTRRADQSAVLIGSLMAVLGGVLAVVGLGTELGMSVFGVLLVVVGVWLVYDAEESATAIEIQTTGEPVSIDVPDGATSLGTAVSRVIAENA